MGVMLAETDGQTWRRAAAALHDGRSVAAACTAAGLHGHTAGRLTAPGAGAWVELLDGIEGARVLVVEHGPGLAGMRLAREAAVVAFADVEEARGHFRRTWLRDQPAEVVVDREERLVTERGPWDLVIVDGLEATLDDNVRRLAAGLASRGRLVVVADNRLSPLRAVDRVAGRPAGPPGPPLRSIERAMRDAGLGVVQRFALLRSSLDGVTAFDLDAPRAAAAVIAAATVNIEHVRALGLRLLRPLARRQAAAMAVPAWMLVASSSTAWAPSPSRTTGRLGHRGSEEAKLLRGEPPVELEKRYASAEAAAREAMALGELEARGLALAPRLLGQPGPDRIRQTWHRGQPMRPAGLRREELRTWVARAAQTIGSIQRATRRSDGTVLVHGDYWLGNLLVDAGRVVAVLDWTRAHWGDPAEDVRHLVDHLVEMGMASGPEVSVLRRVASSAQGEPA